VLGWSGPETRARCPLQQLLAVAILVAAYNIICTVIAADFIKFKGKI